MNDFRQRIQQLFAPESFNNFLRDKWESSPLLVQRRQPNFYEKILSAGQANDLVKLIGRIAEEHQDPSQIMQLIGGEKAAGKSKLRTSVTNLSDALESYKNGSSILVPGIQRFWTPLRQLCDDLERSFQAPINMTLIQSPPNAQAFGRHFDLVDTFVLQISGEKNWRVFDSGSIDPLEDIPGVPFEHSEDRFPFVRSVGGRKRDKDSPILLDCILNAGDLLYFPRGIEHDVWTSSSHSTHITIAIQPVTYLELIVAALRPFITEVEDVRRRLPPPPWDESVLVSIREELERLVEAFSNSIDADGAIKILEKAFARKRISVEEFMGYEQANENGEIDLQSTLEHVASKGVVTLLGETVELAYGDRKFALPAAAYTALVFIAEREKFVVGDLPDLSDSSRIVLSKRLLRARLVRKCQPSDNKTTDAITYEKSIR